MLTIRSSWRTFEWYWCNQKALCVESLQRDHSCLGSGFLVCQYFSDSLLFSFLFWFLHSFRCPPFPLPISVSCDKQKYDTLSTLMFCLELREEPDQNDKHGKKGEDDQGVERLQLSYNCHFWKVDIHYTVLTCTDCKPGRKTCCFRLETLIEVVHF